MVNKLYIKINIIQKPTFSQTNQMVRIDDIKEFHPIIYGEEAKNYFKILAINESFGILNKSKEPYRVVVIPEIFDLLVKQVNKKIGSVYKLNVKYLNITKGQNYEPHIIIQSDSI